MLILSAAFAVGQNNLLPIMEAEIQTEVSTDMTSDIHAMVVNKRLAFLALGENGFMIMDVSSPSAPTPISRMKLNASVIDVNFSGFYLFATLDDGNIVVFNVFKPENPVQIATYTKNAKHFFIAGTIGFLSTEDGRFEILDLKFPKNPIALSNTGQSMTEFQVFQNKVFFHTGSEKLFVLDISDPINPWLTSTYDLNRPIQKLIVSNQGSGAIVMGDEIQIIDVRNTNNITTASSFSVGAPVRFMAFDKNLLFIGTEYSLTLWDIAGVPMVQAAFQVSDTVSVHSVDGFLQVLSKKDGLMVYQYPTLIKSPYAVKRDKMYTRLVEYDGRIYSLSEEGNLVVLKTGDASKEVTELNFSGLDIDYFDIYNGLLYVYSTFAGLSIYNISSSDEPKFISNTKIIGIKEFTVFQGFLVARATFDHIRVYNITDPKGIQFLHTIQIKDVYVGEIYGFYQIGNSLFARNEFDRIFEFSTSPEVNFKGILAERIKDMDIMEETLAILTGTGMKLLHDQQLTARVGISAEEFVSNGTHLFVYSGNLVTVMDRSGVIQGVMTSAGWNAVIADTKLYSVNNGAMIVQDLDNISPIVPPITQYHFGSATNYLLAVVNNYLFVAKSDSVVIYSEAFEPIANISTSQTAKKIEKISDSLVALLFDDSVRFYDITDPSSPILVNAIEGKYDDMIFHDGLAYLVYHTAFVIINYSRISLPTLLGGGSPYNLLVGDYERLALAYPYLYAYEGDLRKVNVLDVSIPSNPVLISEYSLESTYVNDLAIVSGDLIIVGGQVEVFKSAGGFLTKISQIPVSGSKISSNSTNAFILGEDGAVMLNTSSYIPIHGLAVNSLAFSGGYFFGSNATHLLKGGLKLAFITLQETSTSESPYPQMVTILALLLLGRRVMRKPFP